jgi:hypothetical protein
MTPQQVLREKPTQPTTVVQGTVVQNPVVKGTVIQNPIVKGEPTQIVKGTVIQNPIVKGEPMPVVKGQDPLVNKVEIASAPNEEIDGGSKSFKKDKIFRKSLEKINKLIK